MPTNDISTTVAVFGDNEWEALNEKYHAIYGYSVKLRWVPSIEVDLQYLRSIDKNVAGNNYDNLQLWVAKFENSRKQ